MTVSLDGLHPTLMRPRVEALLADPDARAMGVTIVSAFRSIAYQQKLYSDAVAACRDRGYHCPPGNWVAPPGHSNHGPRVDGYGIAVDVGLAGVWADANGQWPDAVSRRFQAIAARHGLYQRMRWEDWHFEPIPNWAPPEEDDMTPEQAAQLARVETATTDLISLAKAQDMRAQDTLKRLERIERQAIILRDSLAALVRRLAARLGLPVRKPAPDGDDPAV